MGISRDIVQTGETGYLAKLGSSEDLATGLFELLKLEAIAYNLMRSNCREYGVKFFHPDIQVKAFEQLCSELSSNGS